MCLHAESGTVPRGSDNLPAMPAIRSLHDFTVAVASMFRSARRYSCFVFKQQLPLLRFSDRGVTAPRRKSIRTRFGILIENLLTPITSRATALPLIVDERRSFRKRTEERERTISNIAKSIENFPLVEYFDDRAIIRINHAARGRSARRKSSTIRSFRIEPGIGKIYYFISNDRDIVRTWNSCSFESERSLSKNWD